MQLITFETAAGVYLGSVNLGNVSGITLSSTAGLQFSFQARTVTVTFADAPARTAFLGTLNDASKIASLWNNQGYKYVAASIATAVTAAA